jgi:hypothetical protein
LKKRLLAGAGAVVAAAAISTTAFATIPSSHSAICAGIAHQESIIENTTPRNARQAAALEARLVSLQAQAEKFGCTPG